MHAPNNINLPRASADSTGLAATEAATAATGAGAVLFESFWTIKEQIVLGITSGSLHATESGITRPPWNYDNGEIN
jgi:hypothetical protein